MDRAPIRIEKTPSHGMAWHPLANLFPLLTGEPFWSLVEDIREHGVREPIVMHEGKVLDGRNRYLAAREAGREYPLVDFDGADPLAYVVSINLKRRHLTEAQRAMTAAEIAKLPPGRPTNNPPIGGISQASAADLMQVSERSVQRAAAVRDHGVPELQAVTLTGDVPLSVAASAARLPEPAQVAVAKAGSPAIRRQIIAAAEAALRPERSPSRRNPDYRPNPLRDAAGLAFDHCREIGELVAAHGATALLDTCRTEPETARALAAVRAAAAAIDQILEASVARAA